MVVAGNVPAELLLEDEPHGSEECKGTQSLELTPQVEEHTVEIDGRSVFYTARGPKDAGYAYLGVNGLMGSGDSFWPPQGQTEQKRRIRF